MQHDTATARQIERDNLNELITAAEAEHGPITDEEIQALRDQLQEQAGTNTTRPTRPATPSP